MPKYITNRPSDGKLVKNVTETTVLVTLYCTRILQTKRLNPFTREELATFTDWDAIFPDWRQTELCIIADLDLILTEQQIKFILDKCRPYVLYVYFDFVDLKHNYPSHLNWLLLEWFPHLYKVESTDRYKSTLYDRVDRDDEYVLGFFSYLDDENKRTFACQLPNMIETGIKNKVK